MVENHYNKIIIIKSGINSFEEYYNSIFRELGCRVLLKNEFYDENKDNKYARRVLALKNSIKKKKSKEFENADLIIVFEDINIATYLSILTKKRVILWYWNKLYGKNFATKFAKRFCEVWTFDSGDAREYKLRLNTQFYKGPLLKASKSNKSVFFVGQDKGRLEFLKVISGELKKLGYECDFHVIPDKDKKYTEQELLYIDNDYMDYNDVIRTIQNSEIIVDLVKRNQEGMTVRILEAMHFKKKIITNNHAIDKVCDIRRNTFIYGVDSMSSLAEFVGKKTMDYESIQNYSVEKWVQRFEELDLCK